MYQAHHTKTWGVANIFDNFQAFGQANLFINIYRKFKCHNATKTETKSLSNSFQQKRVFKQRLESPPRLAEICLKNVRSSRCGQCEFYQNHRRVENPVKHLGWSILRKQFQSSTFTHQRFLQKNFILDV